ncbi:serine/threonine-protein kinase [Microcoleus sp. FACHB-672]|uniref:serine/threonine-protein kinase n=1 Tax=Microcoleus sp. FACHB-672 TaxID=2692825 RepID=UPI001681F8D3|nr:serine/threonine-protein kinase [Microcoleus sp. FACHB-672]MBD2041406.1 serine/threonine protein kinase [Microcoleus sp. FACHB-672]
MSYCLNPNCPKPADPLHNTNRICRHCGSQLVLQNRYRVTRLLGEGGFAKTYEVDDRGQPKVLKVLFLNEPKAVSLFKNEAAVLMRLKHPGIPKVEPDAYFNFLPKHSKAVLHCLVMEKINGPNLEQWLYSRNNKPIPQEIALDWLLQLVDILHRVHQQQFFHRDIKPANIMVRPNGQMVLIDFGSARQVTGTYLAKMGVGQKGTVIASKGYTPPEQDSGHPVPQSDFFALGRTFVHLLTGKHPLDFYNALTDELHWRSNAPQISKPFADFIDHLMARLPGQRPPSTEVMLQRLAEIKQLRQQPSQRQRRRLQFDPLVKFRQKWLTGSVFVLVAGVGVAQAVFYGYFAPRLMSNRSVPVPQQLAIQTPALAESLDAVTEAERPKLMAGSTPEKSAEVAKNSSFEKMSLAETLSGHSLDVRSVAISPDSRTLVSGSLDGTIQIWDLSTGARKATLNEHLKAQELVSSVAITPDGQTLVSGSNSYGGTIKIWNLATGELLQTLPKQIEGVSVVAISTDGKTLASGSEDMTVKLWDLASGVQMGTLVGHSGPIRAVAFSTDGKTVASGSEDTTIRLWNRNTGELISTLSGNSGNVYSVAFSPDGQTVASGSGDNMIKLWDLQAGCAAGKRCYATRSLSGHSGTMYSIAFSSDGKKLAGGGLSGRINIWDAGTGEILQTLAGHSRWVEAVTFSPDGKTLASGSGDATVKIWQVGE